MSTEIITDYEKLCQRSPEYNMVKGFNNGIKDVILELKNTIRENNLLYLTAPQIGKYIRIACINFNGDIKTFVNPILTGVKGFELSREKCNSIPDKEFIIPRYSNVEVGYQNPLGKYECQKFVGLSAKVMQHCIEHLEGILVCDMGLEIDDDFNNATDDEKAEVIKAYLDALDIQEKSLKEEVNKDAELNKLNDAIDFMTEVNEGKIGMEVEQIKKEEDNNECK